MFEQTTAFANIYSETGTNSSPPIRRVLAVRYTDQRSGIELPKYRELISKGLSATTPYTAVRHSFSGQPGRVTMSYRNAVFPDKVDTRYWDSNGVYDPVGFTSLLVPDVTAADNQALRCVQTKITSYTQSFAGLQFLGELRETVTMLRHPLQTLRASINDYQLAVGRLMKAKKGEALVSAITGTYFEYVFGWAQLIRDINAILDVIVGKTQNRKNLRIRCTGTDRQDRVSSSTSSENWFVFNQTVVEQLDTAVTYDIGFAPGTFDPQQSLASVWGLSLSEIPLTVWNCISLSWVVDYFVNVSTLLEALCNPSYGPAYVSRSEKAVCIKSYQRFFDQAATIAQTVGERYLSSGGQLGYCQYMTESFVRTLPDKIPMPTLQAKLPDFWKQWLNIGMLIAQRNMNVRTLRKLGFRG